METALLFGHYPQQHLLQHSVKQGKLAHAWLLTGEKGIGKATFALQAAIWLLAQDETEEVAPPPMFEDMFSDALAEDINTQPATTFTYNPNGQAASLVKAGAHPDLCILECAVDEKTGKQATSISVEAARSVINFCSKTHAIAPWKVVIVDSVDALTYNAANALLKVLEEPPPQTVFFLINHQAGRVLATIRSRCRQMAFMPLAPADFNAVLENRVSSEINLADLYQQAHGVPAIALGLVEENLTEIRKSVHTLLNNLSTLPNYEIQQIFKKLFSAKNNKEAVFSLLKQEIYQHNRTACRAAALRKDSIAVEKRLFIEERLQRLLQTGHALHLDHQHIIWQCIRLLRQAAV